jgi:hypothetical protein
MKDLCRIATYFVIVVATSDGVNSLETHTATAMKSKGLPRIEGYIPSGLDADNIAIHKVALWRQQQDFYQKFSYKNPKTGVVSFNSCMDNDISAQEVCSSHGVCAPFDQLSVVNPVFFCKCDMGWAGPECTIQQKSQAVAWLLSLLFGWSGVDEYYLGWIYLTIFKILGLFFSFMLSALGFTHLGVATMLSYWLYDIVRIGSAPTRSVEAKVAADLPHWAFVCLTMLFFAFIAFVMGICKVFWHVREKRLKSDLETYYCACDDAGYPADINLAKSRYYGAVYGANWNASPQFHSH